MSRALLNLMPTVTRGDIIKLLSEKNTKELAEKFSKKLKINDIVFIYGEMGVGKTTFVKFLINHLQKKNKLNLTEITSPTFNIINEYQINQVKINHYDLFRLKSIIELKNLDLFSDRSTSITIVEWPQIIKEKPKNLIELHFNYDENHKKRSVQVEGIDL